jgi:Icc-related predicted phosphoesterase
VRLSGSARTPTEKLQPDFGSIAGTLFAVQLLLVSDLHYALPHFDWVLDQAADFDIVVIAGDSLDIASPVPLESQIVAVRTYLRKLATLTNVIVCSGNHDLTATNHHGEKYAPWVEQSDVDGVVVDWGTIDLNRTRITVCPWWDGPQTRADVDRQLASSADDRPERWIWVYHYPPDGVEVSWTGHRHIGDQDLNTWIEQHQPDLVLTGHIHDSPMKEGGSWLSRLGTSWVINAGRMTGPMPSHAIVDVATGNAEWWSPYGQGNEQLWPATTA